MGKQGQTTHKVVMEFPYHHRPNASRMEPYRAEIIAMRASNWPLYKISQWLAEHHQVKASIETVRKFCQTRNIGKATTTATVTKTKPVCKKQSYKLWYHRSNPLQTQERP